VLSFGKKEVKKNHKQKIELGKIS